MDNHKRNRRDKRRLGVYRLKRKLKETDNSYGVGGYYFDEDKNRAVRYYSFSVKSKRDIKKGNKRTQRRKLLYVDEVLEIGDTKLPNIVYSPKNVITEKNTNKYNHILSWLL